VVLGIQQDVQAAVTALQQGQLIAYPTESVFGLGCDPQQPEAVERLIKIKQRNPDKGLILIASNFLQLMPYLAEINAELANRARRTWPGPVTWVWPVKKEGLTSPLLMGQYQSIAVRVTNHPIAAALCEEFQGAIVSTSANIENEKPAKTAEQVRERFQNKLDVIVGGNIGSLSRPTPIYDVMTQSELR